MWQRTQSMWEEKERLSQKATDSDSQQRTDTNQTNVGVKAHLDVFPIKLDSSGSHPQGQTPEEPQKDKKNRSSVWTCAIISLGEACVFFPKIEQCKVKSLKRGMTAYLDITSSAVAQPMAATMILYSPLPALRDITRWRPNKSARSTVAFINSCRHTYTK